MQQPNDLETQARQIASAPSKKDGQLAEERSLARRVSTIIAASLQGCKWRGKDTKKPETCDKFVFTSASIFCEKHHKDALFHYDTGKNIKDMYTDWNENLQIVPVVPEKSDVQPIEQFKKTPEDLVEKINAPNGSRFKIAYITNLRAAQNVKKCQACGEKKIAVLTDTSILLCELCFHLGLQVKAGFNEKIGEHYGVTGWASAAKLQWLKSRQTAIPPEECEEVRPPPAALGRRSESRRRRPSRSPEDNRGRSKSTRTENHPNPSSNAGKEPRFSNGAPTESNASGASSMSEESIHISASASVSPTSKATAAFSKLSTDSPKI
jgi:hypothetical protein